MRTIITTLIENSPGEHLSLKSEHGISFLIEKNGEKILFDTGQSEAFIHNAEKLGKDLSDVSQVVISHGHYDHSGGLRSLLAINSSFTFVAGNGFFRKKYATDGKSFEFLGNDFDEQFLKDNCIPIRIISSPLEKILPGIFALTAFERKYPDETINPRFVLDTGTTFIPDDFSDEISLAVETDKGFIILVGCSHPGIKNMLDAAASRLPGPIYGVLGGTHLVEASDRSLAKSIQYFSDSNFGALGVSHCTGKKGTQELERSAASFFRNTTGHAIIL